MAVSAGLPHRHLSTAPGAEGLYYAIPIYFVILGIIAFFSYRRLHKQIMNGSADHVIGHFLAGRTFGPWVTAGTMFASVFSGYTVVGIPNESFTKGFYAFRWMPAFATVNALLIGTGVRLRKIVASIVYLAAQVNSLRSTFNAMFGIPFENIGPVLGIMAIILLMEWCGGLAVIAMSDAFQGVIMVISFLMISIIIKKDFGGWSELDPLTYPRKDFYQTPSSKEQWSFWQFSINLLSFFTLPHMMMRIYACRDLKSLKAGYYAVTLGPWFTMFIGVFIGTVGVQMVWDNTGDVTGEQVLRSPYTAIISVITAKGGFEKGVGVIAFTSSLAAIMSTADSLIIAISHLVTVECVWPFQKGQSNWKIAWIGRLTSLAATTLACIMGIAWQGGVSALTSINFPITMQAAPAFLIGLYTTECGEFHPWSLSCGAWVGFLFVFFFFFLYSYQKPSSAPVDGGIVGVLINLVVVGLVEMVMRWRQRKQPPGGERKNQNRPDWDIPSMERFGEHPLTATMLDKMMTGFPEPLRNGWFVLLVFVSVTICTPIVAEFQPVLKDYQWVSDPPIVRGLPWWFFKQVLMTVIPYAVVLYVLWKTPDMFPFDEKKIDSEGIDPDIMELTAKEMSARAGFDLANESAKRRRSTIIAKMEELGITLEPTAEKSRPPMEKRISSIILRGDVPDKFEEDGDEGDEGIVVEEDNEQGTVEQDSAHIVFP